MAERLDLIITLDNGQLKVASKDSTKAIKGIGDSTEASAQKMQKSTGGIKAAFGSIANAAKGFLGLGIVAGFLSIGRAAIKGAAELEKQQIAFTTMLGSGKEAEKLLKNLRDFAASTPFQLPEITDAGKKLLAFGETAEEIPETLRRIGDVAAGLDVPLGDLTEIYGKARVQQTLYAEDLNQLAGRGIPIFTELAKVTGRNSTEIKKMASEGKIGFGDLEQVFKNLTKEGGQFAGLMEKQSKSLSGLWSTLKDTFENLLISVGQDSLPAFKNLIQAFSSGGRSGGAFAKALQGIGWILGKVVNVIALVVEGINLMTMSMEQHNIAILKAAKAREKELEAQYKAEKSELKRLEIAEDWKATRETIAELEESTAASAESYEASIQNIKDTTKDLFGITQDNKEEMEEFNREQEKALAGLESAQSVQDVDEDGGKKKGDQGEPYEDKLAKRREAFMADLEERNRLLEEYYGVKYDKDQMNEMWENEQRERAMQAHHQYLRNKLMLDSAYIRGVQMMSSAASTFMATNNKALFNYGKLLALTQIGINTAEAVTKALATVPYPLNFVAAATVGSAGAIEAGRVAAAKPPPPPEKGQPSNVIPGLATGTMEVPETNPYLLHKGEGVIPETFMQGIRKTMKNGGSQSQNMTFTSNRTIAIELDGKQIAEVVDTERQNRAFDQGTQDYQMENEY